MMIGGIDGFPLVLDLEGASYSRFRLTTEGVGTLHFDQCEVWSEANGTWSNVSRGKPAQQSSTWRDIHGPETGVSGAITGEAGPHTNAEPNAWWEVDLGKATPCHYLVLFNRLRFHPERMDGLQVFGHGKSGWTLLWSQRNEADLERWGATLLRNLQNRMSMQLAAGLPPQASMATAAQKERSGRSARYYAFLETLSALGKLVPAVQQVNADPDSSEVLKQAVRGGLQAALPQNLHASADELLLFPVAAYQTIHVHTRGPQPEDAPTVEEIFKLEFFPAHADIDQTAPPAVGPQDGYDYISCRMASAMAVPVTDTGLALSVDAPDKFNVKWEIWGEQADGTMTLLYDNTTVTRAIFQMQYLLERDEHPFDDLALGSRALEVEGKYGAAWMFSMYFPTDGPADEEIADYLNKVEYLSHTDGSRRAVSRTKHGYKETFRFKDKEVFTNGIQLVADTIAKGGYVGIPFYGTLLGFLRDDTLIDHDDDGDLVMLNDATNEAEMMEFREGLKTWITENTDWKLYSGDTLPGKNSSVGFLHEIKEGKRGPVRSAWVHVDLFPTWVNDGDRMVLHEGRGGFVPLPNELFNANRDITIEGSSFRIPEKSEDLMELVYGDWRTPYRGYMLGFRYQVLARKMAAAKGSADQI